jgi:putative transposase
MIGPNLAQRLYPFLGGVTRDLGGQLWAIGGMSDHVHLLVRWRTEPSIATLVRDLKHRSSQWVHESIADGAAFGWQRGYGVFTVSPSKSDEVKDYILRQEEHHRQRDFQRELVALLDAHGVEYDPNYLD